MASKFTANSTSIFHFKKTHARLVHHLLSLDFFTVLHLNFFFWGGIGITEFKKKYYLKKKNFDTENKYQNRHDIRSEVLKSLPSLSLFFLRLVETILLVSYELNLTSSFFSPTSKLHSVIIFLSMDATTNYHLTQIMGCPKNIKTC